MTYSNIKPEPGWRWLPLLLFAAAVGMSMLPDLALAGPGGGEGTAGTGVAGSNSIETVMCNFIDIMTSTTGKAIAVVAIIAVGIGALLGKISWGMALIVAIGVALVFGGVTIVEALGGPSGDQCPGLAAILSN